MPCCHLARRAVVRLSGPDVRPFLQGQLTQDVQLLSAAQPLYAGLLSPQGKVLFDLLLFADGADVLLDVAADRTEALVKRLTMFRLRRQVDITPALDLRVWQAWGADVAHPADPRLPAAGARFLAAEAVADAAEADWDAHRLPLGVPETDEIGSDDLLWLETNARELNGVSFTKGCYTGQENTARMHHRDRLRKRLLPLAGSEGEDAPIMAGERNAGAWRGAVHGSLRMALLRTDYLHVELTSGGRPLQLVRPPWLPEESDDA